MARREIAVLPMTPRILLRRFVGLNSPQSRIKSHDGRTAGFIRGTRREFHTSRVSASFTPPATPSMDGALSADPREFSIVSPNTGMSFGCRYFGMNPFEAPPNVPRLLLSHGWLDNLATWDRMMPVLEKLAAKEGKEFSAVAVDFAGHGKSAHRPAGSPYNYTSFASDLLDIGQALGWEKYSLLGHSLGAAVSSLVAAAFPERIAKICMIDNLGPLSRTKEEIVPAYRKHYLSTVGFRDRRKPLYSNLEDAIKARAGGLVPMSYEGASVLVSRGVERLDTPDGEKWTWRTDRALMLPNAQNFTEEGVLEILGAIKAPILAIVATGPSAWLETTFKEMTERRIKVLREHHGDGQVKIVRLEGSHHLHLQERVEDCAEEVWNFLGRDRR